MSARSVILILGLLAGHTCAFAEREPSRRLRVTVELSGQGSFNNSEADKVPGGSYSFRYNGALSSTLRLGVVVRNRIYLGAGYDRWFGRREFSTEGETTKDKLNYNALGAEAGILITANPRVYYLVTAGMWSTLQLEVRSTTSSGETLFRGSKPLTYSVRGALGFKLTSNASLLLHGGYRFLNLKGLASDTGPYLANNPDLDLSGPFLGLGLAVHF